jgi:RNA polymerase sigma-70 factor (ECF subfamily)
VNWLLDPTQRRFEQHVRAYRHRVYGLAVYILGRPAEAEDVAQEVLLTLWEHLDDVEEARMLPWLMRVTRNACIDRIRKRSAYRNVVAPAPEDGLGDAVGNGPTPDAEAEAADLQRHLRRALGRVDEPYRSLLILRDIQGLSYQEISAAMDLPLNTMKVYLHRGRKRLRATVREMFHHEDVA